MCSQDFYDEVSSAAIMTVLGYFRTISNTDLYNMTLGVQNWTLGSIACGRLYNLLSASLVGEEQEVPLQMDEILKQQPEDSASLIELSGAGFAWRRGAPPTLRDLTLALPRGQLVAITGSMGCGKSTLMLALLGELERTAGTVFKHPDWDSSIAYMPQQHWLQTGTLRQNLCFAPPPAEDAKALGARWLNIVIERCGLQADLDVFEAWLDHDIGEGGGSLSGGQRARVALARAVYSRSRITLLDEPLCALDPALGASVFQHVFAPGGLLRGEGRSVVLITTNPTFLAQCDQVIVVKVSSTASSFTVNAPSHMFQPHEN